MPDKGYDAVLFGGIAVVTAALLQGKYAALWTLIAGAFLLGCLVALTNPSIHSLQRPRCGCAGGVLQAIAMPVNTGPLGNAITLWLGIEPADLFLYVFLPPMLVDSAVRIDYFIFRKVPSHLPISCMVNTQARCMCTMHLNVA